MASYTASARSSPIAAARRVFTCPSSGNRAKTIRRWGGGGTVRNKRAEYIEKRDANRSSDRLRHARSVRRGDEGRDRGAHAGAALRSHARDRAVRRRRGGGVPENDRRVLAGGHDLRLRR